MIFFFENSKKGLAAHMDLHCTTAPMKKNKSNPENIEKKKIKPRRTIGGILGNGQRKGRSQTQYFAVTNSVFVFFLNKKKDILN